MVDIAAIITLLRQDGRASIVFIATAFAAVSFSSLPLLQKASPRYDTFISVFATCRHYFLIYIRQHIDTPPYHLFQPPLRHLRHMILF